MYLLLFYLFSQILTDPRPFSGTVQTNNKGFSDPIFHISAYEWKW